MLVSVGCDKLYFGPGEGLYVVFDFENGTIFQDITLYHFSAINKDVLPFIRTLAGKAVIDFVDGRWTVVLGLPKASWTRLTF